MNIRVADYIFKKIKVLTNSKHCFLLAGGGAMHLNDALGRSSIIPVSMHHEQSAAIAADAYGRVNNSVGIVCVTTGPGGTNAITGVAGAWMESTPLLILSGQVSRANWKRNSQVRQMGFQEADIIPMVKSITKYAEMVIDPMSIRYHLEKAIYLARTGRPGPVWLDIPLDIQAAIVEEDSLKGFNPAEIGNLTETKSETESKIETLIRWIAESKRPLLLGGHGIWLSGAKESFRKLIDTLCIPFQTSWNGIDLVENSHPLFFGRANSYGPRYPNFIIQNCDLLIAIGTKLGLQHIGYNYDAFARGAKKVMVDVDSGEIHKHILKIDLPFHADAKVFIELFLKALHGKSLNNDFQEWTKWCNIRKDRYPICGTEYYQGETYVDPYAFFDTLSDILPEDALIIPGSSGTGFTTSHQVFKIKKNQRFFAWKGLAAMGYGLPASIGGCIAFGKRDTITVIGDGGFQLNIQELATVVHNKLPIKIFVFNNQGYLSIRMTQNNYFNGFLVGTDSTSGVRFPALSKIANAYEMPYMKIENMTNLRGDIQRVLQEKSYILCEVMLDPNKPPLPKLGSRKKSDGTMESNPLEDLVPLLPREEFLSNMIIKPWD